MYLLYYLLNEYLWNFVECEAVFPDNWRYTRDVNIIGLMTQYYFAKVKHPILKICFFLLRVLSTGGIKNNNKHFQI